jgi:hypothetical protein
VMKVTVIEPIGLPILVVIALLLLPIRVIEALVKIWHES